MLLFIIIIIITIIIKQHRQYPSLQYESHIIKEIKEKI